MAEIFVTASQLYSKAEELEQLNATLLSKVEELESQEANLSGMWEGEAKDAFHTAFSNDKTQMSNFYNWVTQYVAKVKEAAENYSVAESKNTQIANERNYK